MGISLSCVFWPYENDGSWAEMSQKGGGWHARRLLAGTSKFTQERRARANARPNTDLALKIDQTEVFKRQNLPADDQSQRPTR